MKTAVMVVTSIVLIFGLCVKKPAKKTLPVLKVPVIGAVIGGAIRNS